MPVHRKALSLVLAGGVLLAGCVAAPSGGVEPPPAPQRASGSPAKGLASEDPSRPFDTDPPDRSAEAQSRCDDTGAGADTVIASIPLPHRPVDLVLDARTSTLYTSSERGDVVSVVDTSSRAVVSTISLRDRPYALFVDASRGSLFATLAAAQAPGGSIAVIDTVRNTPVRSIPFPDARWPTDAVVDPATGLLFVVNSGDHSVAVFDSVTGHRIRRIPVDVDPIYLDVDSETGVVLVSGRKGLAAIDVHTLGVRDTIRMRGGAMAIDHEDGGVYIANQGLGTLSVVDLPAFEVVGRVAVGGRGPSDVAFDTASGLAYVTGALHGELVLIDMATLRIVEQVGGAGSGAWYGSVAVDDATDCVYVADLARDALAVLERRQ